MVVLAFVYSSNHDSSSHKVSEVQLSQHLERLDPNSTKQSRERLFGVSEWEGAVDLFVKQHYLVKEKEEDGDASVGIVGLGPRAFVEVGRKQVVFFTHEAVDQAVDPSLLEELAEDDRAPQEAIADEEDNKA